MQYKLSEDSTLKWDDHWHHIQIPLKDFTEQGACESEKWEPSQGKFGWNRIDRFEIISEHHDLRGANFYIDDMKITKGDSTIVISRRNTKRGVSLNQN